jgi:hypothetical protein
MGSAALTMCEPYSPVDDCSIAIEFSLAIEMVARTDTLVEVLRRGKRKR